MKKLVQITSGRGPSECNFVVTNVFRKFSEACKNKNIEMEVIEREIDSDFNQIKNLLLEIERKNLDVFLGNWIGTILWIGKSLYRKFHQRKNWFIVFFEFEVPEENHFLTKEIVYQSIHSSANG